MRRFRKFVFKGHFDRLQREDARRVPDHKRCLDDTAQGLGIVPRQVEDEVERPRGTEELEMGRFINVVLCRQDTTSLNVTLTNAL